MSRPSQKQLFFRNIGAAFIVSVALAAIIISCNDTGTSPYPPSIAYQRAKISAKNDRAIVPDSIISSNGYVSQYSVGSALPLPAGLTLNSTTGLISGTPTLEAALAAVSAESTYSVIAKGPRGIDTAFVTIVVKIDTSVPDIYYDSPFLWRNAGVAASPDTVTSIGGPVTNYSISPTLPAGMMLDATTGKISGTPTVTSPAKSYQIIASSRYGMDTAAESFGVYDKTFPTIFLKKGQARFEGICSGCHGMDAEGSQPEVHPGMGNLPPLRNSDFLMANRTRAIRIQFLGLPNPFDTATTIIVKGDTYQSSMPSIGGTDSDIASVLTFVRATFNGATDFITLQEVGKVRDTLVADSTGVDPNHN